MESVDRAKLYRKVKLGILPFAFLLYFFNGIDRINLGMAALTMNKDLGITPIAFGTISGLFFISYLLFQIPMVMLLKKSGARLIIPIMACLWGIATFLTFFAQDATQVGILRFLIGFAEAGFFPGMIYWFTLWFPSRERGSVVSLFMLAITFAMVLGSPIAGVITQYINWGGYAGWRWLFAIEGVIPAVFALFGFIVLKDGPEKAKWLTDEEKAAIHADLEAEKALTNVKTTKVGIARILSNGMLWKLAMIYMFVQISVMTAIGWIPLITKNFIPDLSPSTVGYILIIPYILGAVAMVIFGHTSDKTGERKWHIIIPILVLSASFLAMIINVGNLPYLIIMLAIYGIASSSWSAPYWTLPPALLSSEIIAVAIAFINSWSAFGGWAGSQVSGFIVTGFGYTGLLVFLAACVLVTVVLLFTLDFKKCAVDRIHDKAALNPK